MTSCVPFALSRLIGDAITPKALNLLLRQYVQDGFVSFDDDGRVGVTTEGFVAVAIDCGFRVSSYVGDTTRTVREWGEWTANARPQPLMLWIDCCNGTAHAMLAYRGLVYDQDYRGGIAPDAHPAAAETVFLCQRITPPATGRVSRPEQGRQCRQAIAQAGFPVPRTSGNENSVSGRTLGDRG